MFLIKYLKSLLCLFISIVILTLIISILNYTNIINNNSMPYFKLSSLIISLFISGIYIGKHATNKGYLEGFKVSLIFIIISFLFNYLGLNNNISLKIFIFYIISIISTVLGSIIGINKNT
ncbi:MAG: TIGR04086 family membrane protein [bacterium]|nr:TIGR04086 family membrane protein [bacterium]